MRRNERECIINTDATGKVSTKSGFLLINGSSLQRESSTGRRRLECAGSFTRVAVLLARRHREGRSHKNRLASPASLYRKSPHLGNRGIVGCRCRRPTKQGDPIPPTLYGLVGADFANSASTIDASRSLADRPAMTWAICSRVSLKRGVLSSMAGILRSMT